LKNGVNFRFKNSTVYTYKYANGRIPGKVEMLEKTVSGRKSWKNRKETSSS